MRLDAARIGSPLPAAEVGFVGSGQLTQQMVINPFSLDAFPEQITRHQQIAGEFVGLALDNDNQKDQTEERVDTWLEQIKPELLA